MEKLWRCPIRGENWFLSVPSAGRVTGCTSRASGGRAYFYPRPPRGGRPQCISGQPETRRFLSTPSARRATLSLQTWESRLFYFYPRPPRGGRPVVEALGLVAVGISIHALREEGDRLSLVLRSVCLHFYPRPPRGGRPRHLDKRSHKHIISIHALREEGDLLWGDTVHRPIQFLSTPSARRATLDLPFSA